MKSRDISKYDLDWQVFRVCSLKGKSTADKIQLIDVYYQSNRNIDTKERVLNYLQGLFDKETESLYSKIKSDITGDKAECAFEVQKYSKEDLLKVFKDLNLRNNRWLDKGYRHQEQIDFLRRLGNYLELDMSSFEERIKSSFEKVNSHKFLF